MNALWLDAIKWDADGLVPAIAQDAASGRVLMMAWMNRAALQETAASGREEYWSRSRGKLWRKGEESGHVQTVKDVRLDCDADVILLSVEQAGGLACHTGRESCIFLRLDHAHWQAAAQVLKPAAEISPGQATECGADPVGRGAGGAQRGRSLEFLCRRPLCQGLGRHTLYDRRRGH